MLAVGQPAPNFSGPDIIHPGVTFNLSDHAGQVVCLAFGAWWCPHCADEIDRLQNLWGKYQGHGVQIVFVHTENYPAQGLNWLTTHGVTFPALQDDAANTIWNPYATGDTGVPQCFVIGRDGLVSSTMYGAYPETTIEGHILDALYARGPVDLAMVMDVSDSMNSPSAGDSKLDMMRQACTMITDFLIEHGQPNDRMGLVWFTDNATEYHNTAGEALLPVVSHSAELEAQINAHGTGVCTAMGAGLQTAFDRLSSSTQKRAIVLCTDGMQNIEPKVTAVGDHFEIVDSGGWLCGPHSSVPAHAGVSIASYNASIHTIGIGVEATYEPLLQQIADATGGFYNATHDPATELDLIYFVDLCNCLADGSPAIVHHAIGTVASNGEAVERFPLNASTRKLAVLLSWPRSTTGSLTFWLYAPDGTLLDLHQELKHYGDHCLATLYLPRKEKSRTVEAAGEWRLVIKGEAIEALVAYHAFVISEDRKIHFTLDYPRKAYEVGDILPLTALLTDGKKAVGRIQDVVVEAATPRESIAELLARYKVSGTRPKDENELGRPKYQKDPLAAKLEAMSNDPRYAKLLLPARRTMSLREGNLNLTIAEHGITIPIALDKPGLHAFKVSVLGENAKTGPIHRSSRVAVHVGPGRAEPQHTKGNVTEVSTLAFRGALITLTPRTRSGALLGPGFASQLSVSVAKAPAAATIEDGLDGTYQIEVPLAEGAPRAPIAVSFRGKPIWQSGA